MPDTANSIFGLASDFIRYVNYITILVTFYVMSEAFTKLLQLRKEFNEKLPVKSQKGCLFEKASIYDEKRGVETSESRCFHI